MKRSLIKNIAIIGSTGSIGTQALDVIRSNSYLFKVEVLTAQNNADLLIKQALEFNPTSVVITNIDLVDKVKSALSNTQINVYGGESTLAKIVTEENIDIVLTALVGYAGLIPTIEAIKAGKNIALANKETLVVAGELITRLADYHEVGIYPVDSEHSAIFQCLAGESQNKIEKIILTASGGPFRGRNNKSLIDVTVSDALKHPNWSMGSKITIDSATLMNKGLEVIEAKWLFDVNANEIEVVVHPQSIIHSLVQFEDGSIKAQLGLPDMKLPIQYALGFPERLANDFPRFSFWDYPTLTFEKPDMSTFACLQLAYNALEKGGNMPCILNAANEIAVESFLKEKIHFLEIPTIIQKTMESLTFIAKPSLDDYIETNTEARNYTLNTVNKGIKEIFIK